MSGGFLSPESFCSDCLVLLSQVLSTFLLFYKSLYVGVLANYCRILSSGTFALTHVNIINQQLILQHCSTCFPTLPLIMVKKFSHFSGKISVPYKLFS